MNRHLLAFAAGLLAVSAQAQESAPPPDLSGFWSPDRDQGPFDEEMRAKLPEGTVILEDSGFVEFPPGEYGGLDVKPEPLEKAAEWQPADALSLRNVCATPSVIYTMQGPFPFEIHQTSDVVVFKLEYFDQVRVVYMDGRGHPPEDAPHSNLGHSIGRWEGDELVIDTTHILPSTLTNNGLDHSAEVHFVERYKLADDGTVLKGSQWFEDPEVLNNSGARYMTWRKEPGSYVLPYSCDPTFAVDYSEVDEGANLGDDEFEVVE